MIRFPIGTLVLSGLVLLGGCDEPEKQQEDTAANTEWDGSDGGGDADVPDDGETDAGDDGDGSDGDGSDGSGGTDTAAQDDTAESHDTASTSDDDGGSDTADSVVDDATDADDGLDDDGVDDPADASDDGTSLDGLSPSDCTASDGTPGFYDCELNCIATTFFACNLFNVYLQPRGAEFDEPVRSTSSPGYCFVFCFDFCL